MTIEAKTLFSEREKIEKEIFYNFFGYEHKNIEIFPVFGKFQFLPNSKSDIGSNKKMSK